LGTSEVLKDLIENILDDVRQNLYDGLSLVWCWKYFDYDNVAVHYRGHE